MQGHPRRLQSVRRFDTCRNPRRNIRHRLPQPTAPSLPSCVASTGLRQVTTELPAPQWDLVGGTLSRLGSFAYCAILTRQHVWNCLGLTVPRRPIEPPRPPTLSLCERKRGAGPPQTLKEGHPNAGGSLAFAPFFDSVGQLVGAFHTRPVGAENVDARGERCPTS